MKKKLFCISLYFMLAMILSAQTTGGGEFFSNGVQFLEKFYQGMVAFASMAAVVCLVGAIIMQFVQHNTLAAIGLLFGFIISMGFVIKAKELVEGMGGSTLQIERIEKGDNSVKKITLYSQ